MNADRPTAAERAVLDALAGPRELRWDDLVARASLPPAVVSDAVETLLRRGAIQLIRKVTPQPVAIGLRESELRSTPKSRPPVTSRRASSPDGA